MMKILGAAVLALAMTGCGGPLEDDGTDATGTAQQAVLKSDSAPKMPSETPTLNLALLRSQQENVVGAPAVQERMHLTNPLHPGCP